MAISGFVTLVAIFIAWCLQFSMVLPDQRFRLQHHSEESSIAVKYPTQDTLKGRHVVKYPTQDTLERGHSLLKPCGDARCLCSTTYAHCQNHGRNLSYIPKLPNTIQYLNFSLNYLPYFDNTTFSNLTSSNITHIELGGNNLTNCSSNAFQNLKQVLVLIINDDNLSSESLKRCLASIDSKFIYRLNLLGLKFTHGFKSDLFSEMNNNSVLGLRELSLYGSHIKVYNQSAFSQFTKLEEIYLGYCQLSDAIVGSAPNLKRLALQYNGLFEIPNFCENGGNLYPKMVWLCLDYNNIGYIHQQSLECLKSLTHLLISNNRIKTLEPNTFSRIPNLSKIMLEFNNEKMYIRAHAFNSSSLTRLFLETNYLHLHDIGQLSLDAFKDCPNLKLLYLQENNLQCNGNIETDQALQSLMGSLPNLEEFNLARTQLSKLPKVISQKMPKLKKLNAQTNLISQWPTDYFHNLTNLKELDLSENKIAVLKKTSFSEGNLKTFKLINLQKNSFSCTCDLLWFLDYLKTSNNSRKFEFWPNDYTCNTPPELHGSKLNNVLLNDHSCLEKTAKLAHNLCVSSTYDFYILYFLCISISLETKILGTHDQISADSISKDDKRKR